MVLPLKVICERALGLVRLDGLDKALSQNSTPFFKGAEESESLPYGQRLLRGKSIHQFGQSLGVTVGV